MPFVQNPFARRARTTRMLYFYVKPQMRVAKSPEPLWCSQNPLKNNLENVRSRQLGFHGFPHHILIPVFKHFLFQTFRARILSPKVDAERGSLVETYQACSQTGLDWGLTSVSIFHGVAFFSQKVGFIPGLRRIARPSVALGHQAKQRIVAQGEEPKPRSSTRRGLP